MASLFKGFDLLALPGVPSTAMAIDVREVWVGEKDIVVRPRYSVTPRLEPHRFASDQPASLPGEGDAGGVANDGGFRRRWSSVAGNGQALTGVMLFV
ncbi:hypothetical protein CJU75_11455 [Pseudomonas fragi]|nr:hypothetical protein CJU75_11455 [Pseudomonas fragi]